MKDDERFCLNSFLPSKNPGLEATFRVIRRSLRGKQTFLFLLLIAAIVGSCKTSTFYAVPDIKEGVGYDAVQLSNGEVVRFSPPATYEARDSMMRGRSTVGDVLAIPLHDIMSASTSEVTTGTIVFDALLVGAGIVLLILFAQAFGGPHPN